MVGIMGATDQETLWTGQSVARGLRAPNSSVGHCAMTPGLPRAQERPTWASVHDAVLQQLGMETSGGFSTGACSLSREAPDVE